MPAHTDAINELKECNDLKMLDLTEMKSLNNPPQMVKHTTTFAGLILGMPFEEAEQWAIARKQVLDIKNFTNSGALTERTFSAQAWKQIDTFYKAN